MPPKKKDAKKGGDAGEIGQYANPPRPSVYVIESLSFVFAGPHLPLAPDDSAISGLHHLQLQEKTPSSSSPTT